MRDFLLLILFLNLLTFYPSKSKCQINLGFEDGTFNGWMGTMQDRNIRNHPFDIQPRPLQQGFLQHCIIDGSLIDPLLPIISVVPPGKNRSARIGNTAADGSIITLKQTFRVNSLKPILTYYYAQVLENPVDQSGASPIGHEGYKRPHFVAQILDSNGNQLPCTENIVVAAAKLSGFEKYCVSMPQTSPAPATNIGCPPGSIGHDNSPTYYSRYSNKDTNMVCESDAIDIYYSGWKSVTLNLTAYINKPVTLEFVAADCTPNGHRAYAYVCAEITALQDSLNPVIMYDYETSKTLPGPSGYDAYSWSGPSQGIIGKSDTATITIQKTGKYFVEAKKYFILDTCTQTFYYVVTNDTSVLTNTPLPYKSKINVYPNPTNGQVTVQCSQMVQPEIILADVTGQIVPIVTMPHGAQYSFNTSELCRGAYILTIKDQTQVNYIKLVLY